MEDTNLVWIPSIVCMYPGEDFDLKVYKYKEKQIFINFWVLIWWLSLFPRKINVKGLHGSPSIYFYFKTSCISGLQLTRIIHFWFIIQVFWIDNLINSWLHTLIWKTSRSIICLKVGSYKIKISNGSLSVGVMCLAEHGILTSDLYVAACHLHSNGIPVEH